MSETETLSVVVERDMPYPPSKLWRALTQPHLMAEWLMRTDFEPQVGRPFKFTADWGSVDCEVLEIDPERSLSYKWGGHGLDSVVTWTLSPTAGGTRVRMEQSGFPPNGRHFYNGAKAGWPNFFDKLETVLARET